MSDPKIGNNFKRIGIIINAILKLVVFKWRYFIKILLSRLGSEFNDPGLIFAIFEHEYKLMVCTSELHCMIPYSVTSRLLGTPENASEPINSQQILL